MQKLLLFKIEPEYGISHFIDAFDSEAEINIYIDATIKDINKNIQYAGEYYAIPSLYYDLRPKKRPTKK